MNQVYWVSFWAKRRQDEVVRVPADYKIHEDFLPHMDKAEVRSVFEGLKNNKLTNNDISITYPDNPAMLCLLKQLADKAHSTKIIYNARSLKKEEYSRNREADRICDFLCCHFRLLQDDMNTADYGFGADDVADRVLTDSEKEFAYKLDEALTSTGFVSELYGGIECHGIAYYHSEKDMRSKKPYAYRIMTRGMDFEQPDDEAEKMRLELRIRNVSNCLEYLASCPDSVKSIFTDYSDAGCTARQNNVCKHGIDYKIDGNNYWRCACCGAAFNFKPKLADISHYLKLIELGEKR